jgi:outer membrane protein, heavy metal efflux system
MMTRKWPIALLSTAALLLSQAAGAQQQTQPPDQRPQIAFAPYVAEVLRSNLGLLVQRSNIAISQAQVTTAFARPDWSLGIGLPTADLSGLGFPTTTSAGLTVPVELGGKRGARVRAASADVLTTMSDYDDAVRLLRATAANAFIDALGKRAVLQSKNRSLAQLERIVGVNQERLRAGDIGEIELAQSRVERDQFKADVVGAEADVYSADIVFAQQLGRSENLGTAILAPSGTLEIGIRTFLLDDLLAVALKNRSDVVSKTRALQAADRRIELAKSNLVPDLALSGTFSHTGTGTGDFLQQPDNVFSGGVSLNLPLSRRIHPGEVEGARAAHTQAELQLRAVQLQVEAEVRDAYRRYEASTRKLSLYRAGMLRDADRVLDARLYAYQRGGATLLEVIDAQRKSAEVYLGYSQALVDHAHALVALEQAAGIWDVTF